jgi:hypothetical protein
MCVLDNLMNFHFSPPGIRSRSWDHGTEEVSCLHIYPVRSTSLSIDSTSGMRTLVTFHFSAPIFVLHGIPSFPRTVLRRRGKLLPYIQIPNSTVSACLSLRLHLTYRNGVLWGSQLRSKLTHSLRSSMTVVSSSFHSLYPTGELVYTLAILSYFPADFSATFRGVASRVLASILSELGRRVVFWLLDCPAVCEFGIFSSAGTIDPATPTCLYPTWAMLRCAALSLFFWTFAFPITARPRSR